MTGKTWKSPIVWFFLLVCVYFATRLIQLTTLPIFTDEAIYIRWSQIGSADAAWRFISLTDGKQPFFTWLIMASVRLFQDPLFAGRIVSVIGGFLSLIGLVVLSRELFKNISIGLIAAALYVISPFTLMYDRLALYDTWVATFSIWNLYLAVLLVKRVRFDVALLLGMMLGAGMLNKTSAFLSLYMLPATLILFDWKRSNLLKRLTLWIGYVVIAAVLSQIIYSVLRLSPFFYIVSQKDALFVYPFSEWLVHPFSFFRGNIRGLFNWLQGYMTWPILITAGIALLVPRRSYRERLLLFGWWVAPFIALALFGRILYPRFILFMTMPLLILAAYTIAWVATFIRKSWIFLFLILCICGYSVTISTRILIDIKSAPILKADRGQLVDDWPSGWGTNEVVSFLKSRQEPVVVYTEGTFGLFPYALELFLHNNPSVEIHGLWPINDTIPQEMLASAATKPTYFVSNFTQKQFLWPMTLLETYQKGNNPKSVMRLYQVIPTAEK
jgi:4-amino-4-deoxy-L-arabinose transferase-like glycosyltransferase